MLPVLLSVPLARAAAAAELKVESMLRTAGTSNVFLDRSAEADVSFHPIAEIRGNFGDYWSTGYSGQLTVFAQHPELLSHQHELFFFANPVWGEDGENELAIEARLETLRNSDSYQALNIIRPVLLGRIGLEPRSYFRWEADLELTYRWFYDDVATDSLDGLGEVRLVFMLPSRTTLIGRAGYGLRRFTRATSTVDDVFDQQVDIGGRIGQGLWKGAGLQLDFNYRWLIGGSGVLQRKVTTEQTFQYLGDDFVVGGPRAQLALKQVWGTSWTGRLTLSAEERRFAGWPALDSQGEPVGEDRRDLRLIPGAMLSYAWERQQAGLLRAGRIVLEYQHIVQWSNFYEYEAQADQGGLELVVEW